MLSSTLLASLLLALPLSVLGQQQNATSSGGGNGGNSTTTAAPQITQSYSVYETLVVNGTNRNQVTTSMLVNVTVGGASQTANKESSSTSTTPTTLPFAPSTVDAGSNPTVVAPRPGQSGGTQSGPNDSYHAGAGRAVMIGAGTVVLGLVGGVMVLL